MPIRPSGVVPVRNATTGTTSSGGTSARTATFSLRFVVAGGEYRFLESFYESGLFIGLGAYELEGTNLVGASDSESGAGLVLGATGEFEINRRVGFLIELLGDTTILLHRLESDLPIVATLQEARQ